MIDRRKLSRHVTKGAALLDKTRPGWADEIDVERLDLLDGCDCVLGQLHGGYEKGLEALGQFSDQASSAAHGFDGEDGQATREVYAFLTAAWKRRIAKRVTPTEGTS